MDHQERTRTLQRLFSQVRVASLSTLNDGTPFGSMVPYIVRPDTGCLYIHLSRMARHTRHIDADARVAVLVTEADGPDKNPLALVRACLWGKIEKVDRETPEYSATKQAYLALFPDAEMIFQLPDFAFYRLAPEGIHLVAGFGKAFRIDPRDLIVG